MINNKNNYANFYSSSEGHAYGEVNEIVKTAVEYIDGGTVLDLGAGDGRHAVFLAKQGLEVTALDSSEVGLYKLQKIAAENKVQIEVVLADLAEWKFEKDYDLIVATAIFQHLNSEQALKVLDEMKKHTRINGLNVITLFTNNGDRYLLDQQEDPLAFYPEDGWLKSFYTGWEILKYEEKESALIGKFRKDGSALSNVVAKLLARKI